MSSGKETEFSESVSEGVVSSGEETLFSSDTYSENSVSFPEDTTPRVRVREVRCLLERRPSFLSTCPRGVVSSGKETEFSEYVSEGCGVFWKGDRVSEFVSEGCGVFCKGDRVF